MERIGLYRGQAILLMILSRHDGITHSEIAEKLRISPAAATKVIKRMEQAGYLQRQADPADERVSRIYLQDPGRALIAEIESVFGKLGRAMFEGVPERDLEQVSRPIDTWRPTCSDTSQCRFRRVETRRAGVGDEELTLIEIGPPRGPVQAGDVPGAHLRAARCAL
jgi:DNA-binding MarR family transcriptional regulator